MNAQGAINTKEEAKANVLESGNLRKAWYGSFDHLHTLRNCAEILDDKKLAKNVRMMLETLDDTYNHLEENYKWD